MEKNREVSEDEGKKGLEKLQKITDECIKEAEKFSETKEKDILNV
jgi:ribosome recycling factor